MSTPTLREPVAQSPNLFGDTADGRRRRRFLRMIREHSENGGRGLLHSTALAHFNDARSLAVSLEEHGYIVAHPVRPSTGRPGTVYRLSSDGAPPRSPGNALKQAASEASG